MIDKKIKEILVEGFDDYKEGKSYYENTVPRLKQLFREEMMACLPEKKKPHTYSSENSDEYIAFCIVHNDVISKIEQNINKLSEK